MFIIWEIIIAGAVSFVYTIYREATRPSGERRKAARREAICQQLSALPSQECVSRLKEVRDDVMQAGLSGRYLRGLVAVIAAASSGKSDRGAIANEIGHIRATMAYEGVLSAEMDRKLAEAAGALSRN